MLTALILISTLVAAAVIHFLVTGTITKNITIGGTSVSATVTRSAEANITLEMALPAAKTGGTLSLRTDANNGTVTLAGHGRTGTPRINIFWSVGGVRGAAFGASGTVSGDDITFLTSEGDDLPVVDTAVTFAEQIEANIDFDGDDLALISVSADQIAHAQFADSADVTLQGVHITAANEPWDWADNQGITRPITGNAVDKVYVSNGSTIVGAIRVAAIYEPP